MTLFIHFYLNSMAVMFAIVLAGMEEDFHGAELRSVIALVLLAATISLYWPFFVAMYAYKEGSR